MTGFRWLIVKLNPFIIHTGVTCVTQVTQVVNVTRWCQIMRICLPIRTENQETCLKITISVSSGLVICVFVCYNICWHLLDLWVLDFYCCLSLCSELNNWPNLFTITQLSRINTYSNPYHNLLSIFHANCNRHAIFWILLHWIATCKQSFVTQVYIL